MPRHCLSSYGRRAFSVAGPVIWKWLSASLRDPAISRDSFKRSLKSFLFSAYSCTCTLELSGQCALQIYLLTNKLSHRTATIEVRCGSCVTRRSHSFTCHPHTGHTLVCTPQSQGNRTLTGTKLHCAMVPRQDSNPQRINRKFDSLLIAPRII